MEHSEWLRWHSPITGFCKDDELIKIKRLESMEEVEECYRRYKKWCESSKFDERLFTFNQFILHLHQLGIVNAVIFTDYWVETGLPLTEFYS